MDTITGRVLFLEEFESSVFDNPEWRVGQTLFNILPEWAAEVVAKTTFDPFYNRSTGFGFRVWCEWIDNHLIFDEQGLLAVFNNNQILAERPS